MSAQAVQEATGLAAQFKRAVEADDDGAEALLKKLKLAFTKFDSLPPFLSGGGGDAAAAQQALARGHALTTQLDALDFRGAWLIADMPREELPQPRS